VNPSADTQDIKKKRNSMNECLYVDQVGSRSEQKKEKKKTTTTITFCKAIGKQ
jgi:hypothetical protein